MRLVWFIQRLSESCHVPLRPMQLVQVEVRSLQPFQRAKASLGDLLSAQSLCEVCIVNVAVLVLLRISVRADPATRPRSGDFGRQKQLLSPVWLLRDPAPNVLFRPPHHIGGWRYGIELCSVDEIATVVDKPIELSVRVRFVVLHTPCHGTKTAL